MKLKSIDGKVPYIMAAGKDFVKDEMSLAAAEQMISLHDFERKEKHYE